MNYHILEFFMIGVEGAAIFLGASVTIGVVFAAIDYLYERLFK